MDYNQGGQPVLDTAAYDAWGSLLADRVASGTTNYFPVGFGGQWGYYTDRSSGTNTGLLLLGARYYDAGTGRFINRDPIGYGRGINVYGFCGNNPITGNDASGLNPTMDKEDANTIEMMVLDGTDRASATRTVMGNRARIQAQRFKESMDVAANGTTAITMLFGIGETVVLTRAVIAGIAERVAARTAAKIAADAAEEAAAETSAQISRKLQFLFGKATGDEYNINRSLGMARSLDRIGLYDTPEAREYVKNQLLQALRETDNIAETQANGRVVKESLLMGPRGGVKLESIWEGSKLITLKVFSLP